MTQLLLPTLAFLLLHRLVSGGPLRAPLVRIAGETAFRRAFAVASLACTVWLIAAYRFAHRPHTAGWYDPPDLLRWSLLPVQFLAITLIVAGLGARNPGTSGMEEAVDEDVINGLLRVTRHPFLWGIAIMSASHMAVLPDFPSWWFFGTLMTLALSGTISIDAKRRRSLGAAWARFEAATSNFPFAAIVRGRQHLRVNEIGWRLTLRATLAFGVVVAAHAALRLALPR